MDSSFALAPATTLSPVEHVFSGDGGYTITFAFSFAQKLNKEQLERSLAETLVRFPWLWCTLELSPDQRTLRLIPRTESAAFDAKRIDIDTRPGAPLASFCLTHTANGSTLEVSASHALVDAGSLFLFLISWARLTRGEPIFDPVRVPIPYATRDVSSIDPETIWSDCGLYPGGARERIPPDGLTTEPHHLTHADIQALRERAQRDSDIKLSTNDVVTAYVWQKYVLGLCDARHEPEASLMCPVDMRHLLGLPPTHFGCALGFATMKMDVAELRECNLGSLAARIRLAVKSVDAERMLWANGTLEALRRDRGLASIHALHVQHPRSGMLVTNLTRLPISEVDFGLGAPNHVVADARQYNAASFFAHPEGITVLLYWKAHKPS